MAGPTLEFIISSPPRKYLISDFYSWVTRTSEFARFPILSVLRFHSVSAHNVPMEYAVVQCKVSTPAISEIPEHLWILMDMYDVHGFLSGVFRQARIDSDSIFASTDLHCLLDPGPGYEIIEVLHYDPNDVQRPLTTATKTLSLRHIADMYECAMRCLPHDSMADFSWLCYALFECLDRCRTCFRNTTGRGDIFGDPGQRPRVDMPSVAYAAVQYIEENHADCCKLSYMPPTPMKGISLDQFSAMLYSPYVPGPISPLFTPHIRDQDLKKRSYESEEFESNDTSHSFPMTPLIQARPPPSWSRPRIDGDLDSGPTLDQRNPALISIPERPVKSTADIVTALGYYGCINLGHRLDPRSCGEYPMCNGGLGDIYKGQLDGLKVAIKTTRMYVMNKDEKYLKASAVLYLDPNIVLTLRHPNVLSLLGLVEFRGQIGMVSEWMDNGDIRKYLSTRPEVDRYQLCYYISDGLTYLHSATIIHGDLKGANILISDSGMPKLTDFGNAVLQECSLQFTESATRANISPRWTAPEILAGSISSSYAADVYALGMTWLEVITGKVPFHELRRDQALYHLIVNERKIPERPNEHIPTDTKYGDSFWSLLVKCWAYMPEERPSAPEARDLVQEIKWPD